MRTFRTIVVGLGAFGSALAAELAQRGSTVLGIDRWRPPHTLGSSHGGSRIIRKVYFEDPLYVPLLERAYEGWRRLEAARGLDLFHETGSLTMGPERGQLVPGAEASANLHHLHRELLGAEEVMRRFPNFRVPDGTVATYDPEAGVLRPERAIQAQLDRAREGGAELHFGEAVRRWEEAADGLVVHTERESYRADGLVLAAGAWAGELAGASESPLPEGLEIERAVQHWFEPVAGTARRFAIGVQPAFVWELDDGLIWYGLPDLEGGMKVALHYAGERVARVAEVRREVEASDVADLEGLLRRYLPDALGKHRGSKVCLYTVTGDTHFRIDHLPGARRVLVVSACSGHGFKFAPAVGELVAEEVLTGRRHAELAPFAWRRPAVA
jgi:sarcosine oxidase